MADDAPVATMIDVAFPLQGSALARDHRRLLTDALETHLPWLAALHHAWLHPVRLSPGDDAVAPLSRRSRLMLRVPRDRASDVMQLTGATLRVGAQTLVPGSPRARPLLPHTTLYSHLVAAGAAGEVEFLCAIDAELEALAVHCRTICGRRQATDGGALEGFSLMLDGLTPQASLRVLEAGLGAQRRLGCGLFVPHRSAAAVGA